MERAYASIAAAELERLSDAEILGRLAGKLPFAVELAQRAAWQYQIDHLRRLALALPSAHFFLEFLIPRMGRRADLIIVEAGLLFVVEYKIGSPYFDRAALEQVYGYGLDLKNFHETSHHLQVLPILVATETAWADQELLLWDPDGLARPQKCSPDQLAPFIRQVCLEARRDAIDPQAWMEGGYRPTPTIVEAAQALYQGHGVDEISRSEAGAENLTRTAHHVQALIETARREGRKIICFITGVPGSGKTLAGLNIATSRQRAAADDHAVFLSGNGPLVAVLREALALDAVETAARERRRTSKAQEYRRASAFIQNIHHFRDEALASPAAPDERVAIFDEAQRAWDVAQTSKFMRQKRGQLGFARSEPEFLLSVMDRHEDWCAIICLIGGGQEINTGEAGLEEWLRAARESFPNWQVHGPPTIAMHGLPSAIVAPELHLATSIRSFRSERLSDFVGHVIDGDAEAAKALADVLGNYPLFVTRDLAKARTWLRAQRRGRERAGLLASSNGARLKPHGVFVKAAIEPEKWFLAPADDVRSSDALEDAATEFDVQGLELDWVGVCWDANFRREGGDWAALQFKGTRWQRVNDAARKRYLANSYRVLLTRGRQGLVVFVPEGSVDDPTRPPAAYDDIYRFLLACGFAAL